ncbi:RNA polymerase sigma factor [Planctomycetes bacterium K23_9]|uniref:RNA polymerase sigma factor SigM n=1 Tax=Stieleria marina TaxID=1930275 RepID=A0A517NWV7_9BACT|nr:RNA polymerase sigma factor SigM [Planctomycetes bacterium K23_9]
MDNPNHIDPWLSDVFREFELPLMGYATQLLGNPDRASDVVQDTFVRLCRQERSDVQHCVRPWLYRVCRNRALDVLKKEKRMKTLDEQTAATEVSREVDPQQAAQSRDSSAKAKGLIEQLPARQQEIIRLKIQGGLSYREISDLTGLSVSNVGYLLSTALASVRTRLAATN